MNSALRVVVIPLLLLSGCSHDPGGRYQGYIEGEFVYVTAPVAGTLTDLAVSRGDRVIAGQLLFQLDPEPEASARAEAERRVEQAEARLSDLSKGARPTEISALRSRLAAARADAAYAESEVERFTELQRERVISPDAMDRARSQRDAAQATVASLEAELETAGLGARSDEVAAAGRDVDAAKDALAQARWAVDQKRQSAPAEGAVDDTLFREGEWVGAGRAVVSMLPPANIKVRFFVPEPDLAAVRPGQEISVAIDGVPQELRGRVSYVSTQAEFTPPVIFSRENRAKLVFMVEAVFAPDDAARLHPGQPADVRLAQ